MWRPSVKSEMWKWLRTWWRDEQANEESHILIYCEGVSGFQFVQIFWLPQD